MAIRLGITTILAAASMISVAAGEETAAGDSIWSTAPKFEGDGWVLKIGGRVQLDYSFVDAEIAGADWDDGELRRARLNVAGKFGDKLKYKIELHTDSSGNVDLEDGYVQWAPTGAKWNVRAGQFNTPNSIDELTSSRFTSMLERAAFTDAFDFNRRLGVSVNAKGDTYTLSAGIFGDNVNMQNQLKGFAFAARATINPIKRDDLVVHLGASMRYRNMGATQGDIRYRQRPASHIPGRILSTGAIADADLFIGVEAAAIKNNFWAASEYGVTFANCSMAAACADPTLQGAYGEVGVFFGGRRTYKGGRFNRPKVDNPVTKGGMGALSLVARFDTLDLNDSGVNGGSYNSYTIGSHWWATKYTRLSVNLFKTDADFGATTSGLDPVFAGLVNANVTMEDVTGVQLRAQLDF